MREVYLHGIGQRLGTLSRSVEEAEQLRLLLSPASALRAAGYSRHRAATDDERALDLAIEASRAALGEGVVDLLCYATALAENSVLASDAHDDRRDVKSRLRFSASALQAALGYDDAYVLGIHQQACTGILGALRVAHSMLQVDARMSSALCLTADRFPAGSYVEQAYHLVSDGAVAAKLSVEPSDLRLVAFQGESNGALAQASDEETVGSFFAHAARVVDRLTEHAGIADDDIDWIVPQNLPTQACAILARMLAIDPERVATPTREEIGHLIGGDPLLNLAALREAGSLRAGQRVVLFAAGYGLHWQAALLEVAA